jgi:uncharacterized protein with HEPN domain
MTGRRGDALRLADIARSIERLQEVLAAGYDEFSRSWITQSAVVRELEIIGEAAGEVSVALRRKHTDVGWARMRGFSSFAKHEYWRVRPELLWDAVKEMPVLRDRIRKVIAPL